MIAALFVETDGVYFGLPDVDPWDEQRDARLYAGPHAVVAHPPCSRWCQLAYINQKRYGHKVGSDGGCFDSALQSVLRYGGVLEHPARSYAWRAFGLTQPDKAGWTRGDNYWVCEVAQVQYGHRAIKKTWLLAATIDKPSELIWGVSTPTAQVSYCKNHGNSPLPRLGKREAKQTPIAFRDALLAIARGCA